MSISGKTTNTMVHNFGYTNESISISSKVVVFLSGCIGISMGEEVTFIRELFEGQSRHCVSFRGTRIGHL